MWKAGRNTVFGLVGLSVVGLAAGGANAGGYGHRWHDRGRVTVIKRIYVHDHWRHRRRPAVRYVYEAPPPVRVVQYDHYYGGSYYGGNGYSNRTVLGGLIGAAVGALAGNSIGKGGGRVAAIIGGGLIGAIVGGNIGQSMDRVDALEASNALETARTGQTVSWRNPDSGTRYSVMPTRTYQEESGRYCREFTTWGWIDGYEEKLHGTACRKDDGTWQRVS